MASIKKDLEGSYGSFSLYDKNILHHSQSIHFAEEVKLSRTSIIFSMIGMAITVIFALTAVKHASLKTPKNEMSIFYQSAQPFEHDTDLDVAKYLEGAEIWVYGSKYSHVIEPYAEVTFKVQAPSYPEFKLCAAAQSLPPSSYTFCQWFIDGAAVLALQGGNTFQTARVFQDPGAHTVSLLITSKSGAERTLTMPFVVKKTQ